jgi:hypothetical protein
VGETSAARRGNGSTETAAQSAPPKKTMTRDAGYHILAPERLQAIGAELEAHMQGKEADKPEKQGAVNWSPVLWR